MCYNGHRLLGGMICAELRFLAMLAQASQLWMAILLTLAVKQSCGCSVRSGKEFLLVLYANERGSLYKTAQGLRGLRVALSERYRRCFYWVFFTH